MIKILSQSRNIFPPFFEFVRTDIIGLGSANDDVNEDGGKKVDIRDGTTILEVKQVTVNAPVVQTTKKKSFLRIIK